MLNEHFKKVAQAVVTMTKKGEGIFGNLQRFCIDHATNGVESLRGHVKQQEALAKAELKAEMGKNSTYKVAKSVLIRCVENNIPLVGADGKARGKTELEADLEALAAAEPEKSAFEKFQTAMNTVTTLAGKLDEADLAVAAGLISTLYKSVADRIPMAKAA